MKVLLTGARGMLARALIPALAWQERAGSLATAATATRAEPFEAAFKLNGSKSFVAGAAGADGFVVSAQTRDGLALYWVPADAGEAEVEQLLRDYSTPVLRAPSAST